MKVRAWNDKKVNNGPSPLSRTQLTPSITITTMEIKWKRELQTSNTALAQLCFPDPNPNARDRTVTFSVTVTRCCHPYSVPTKILYSAQLCYRMNFKKFNEWLLVREVKTTTSNEHLGFDGHPTVVRAAFATTISYMLHFDEMMC